MPELEAESERTQSQDHQEKQEVFEVKMNIEDMCDNAGSGRRVSLRRDIRWPIRLHPDITGTLPEHPPECGHQTVPKRDIYIRLPPCKIYVRLPKNHWEKYY